jgi:hypothetical protein
MLNLRSVFKLSTLERNKILMKDLKFTNMTYNPNKKKRNTEMTAYYYPS